MKREKVVTFVKSLLGKRSNQTCNFNGEWCASFVDWVIDDNFHTDMKFEYYASCTSQVKRFMELNRFKKSFPQVGDLIYYEWVKEANVYNADHVGFIVDVSGDTITTIEGNFGNGHWSTNTVGTRTIKTSYSCIKGYGVPYYEDDETIRIEPPEQFDTTMVNKYSDEVELIQFILNRCVGIPTTEDGYFGERTMQSVVKFQKDNTLIVDGIVGQQTLKALLKKAEKFLIKE